MTRPDQKYF